MSWKTIMCGAVAVAFAVSTAQAKEPEVQLIDAQGKVLADQGEGYSPAAVGALLKSGDSLFVGQEASATILFIEDGCKWEVPAGTVLVIETPSPCKAQAFVPLLPPLAAAGLLAGGGAAAGALALSDDGNDEDPVSP